METVVAYTDGASSNNQHAKKRQGGWGVLLMLLDPTGVPDTRPEASRELSGSVPGATNNQMELEAVRQALLSLKRDGVNIRILTDSEYVIGVLSLNWKVRANHELVTNIQNLMQRHTVTFEKVAGHGDNPYNHRVDQLAVNASRRGEA